MENKISDLEKIRQQFDYAPYPRIPLDHYPTKIKFVVLYNMVTAYYLRSQKVVETEGKLILDAGCGSGFKSLALAVGNPGARIVGVDLSEESTNLARERLKYHHFTNVEFHTISIYDLPKLGLEFDYIDCDETLYLLPDIVAGLKAMKAVLKPEGIIRTNLHSLSQRRNYFTAQKLFKMLGFMDETPGQLEIEQAREIMNALKNHVSLKANTRVLDDEMDDEWYLMNYLFQGDKGYTIPEIFEALRAADLEFINMVNWPAWNLLDLFQDAGNLPAALGMTIPELSVEEQLHLYEMLHPIHRLIDFWCGHPNAAAPKVPVVEWTDSDWQGATVHLHPSLKVPEVKQEMLAAVTNIKMLEIAKYLPFVKESSLLMDSMVVSCLIPLLEKPMSMRSLVERWRYIRPVNPVNLEPIATETAFDLVKKILTTLEPIGLVLLERPPARA
ncbi:class I SAM-dependent methyltransferase [Planktothrix sp. FACHB-1355]|uniref:Class I SAM-dependent methyltransferase n=1 Tax=Aerosakkonema funiforme FACHB-1375 TaxID=2949571 RepID=A0A926VA33_9CYAN|nr:MULTISPECIES: class I SAM-dependent methyltransferase [Oscillatoriales]MBD2179890.1 class I SAM-dependent methyltransferase [Aerosakkonema funiforme FACHB-1375]MBD3558410.1 class I SAM-dependent methyltransferase [Planktothrix sp. FACHB-1355]